MKKFFTIATWAVSIAPVCLAATSCKKTPTPAEPANLETAISFNSSTETTLTVNINVQEGATGYTYAIGQASDAESFADGTMSGIMTQQDPSIAEVTFEGLTADTQYTVFAQAFNAAGEKGGVARLAAKTAAPEQAPDLNITAVMEDSDITEDSFMIRLTYTEDVQTIEYAVATAADQEAFENGTLEGIKTTAPEKTLIISNLKRGTEYTVFIRAKAGELTGATQVVTGTTMQIDLSLELVEDALTTTSATIHAIPGGDASKFKYTTAVAGIDDLFVNGQWPEISWINSPDPINIKVTGLTAGSDNTFYAQAYAANGARGTLQKLAFKTKTE